MLMPSYDVLYRAACREKDSVNLCPPLTLSYCTGSVQQNLLNNSSAGLESWDPPVTHNEEAHDTKLQPGTQRSSSAADG